MLLYDRCETVFEKLKRKLFPPVCKYPQDAPVVDHTNDVLEKEDYSWLCVCIDNGHGINTSGKRSPYAANEKNLPELYLREYQWCRMTANKLRDELEKYGVDVYMVVPEDSDISLKTRYTRANDYKTKHPDKKCIFISIHNNAAGSGDKWMNARGWAAYTTKGITNSDYFASYLYDAAEEIFPEGTKIRKYKTGKLDRDHEENFTVIYGANMPAVLTENFFQDNVDDVKYLLSDEGIDTIVKVHLEGILRYANTIKPNNI